MAEYKFFTGETSEYASPAWYKTIERAPHLEQSGHRERLLKAAEWINARNPKTVSDLGAGDGGLLSLLTAERKWGYDLMPSNIEGAKERGVEVYLADFLNDPIEYGEMSVLTECLEHQVDPHAVVRMVESKYLVASSPVNENELTHYEYHLWAWDIAGYRALIEQGGYYVLQHETVGGFQVIVGER